MLAKSVSERRNDDTKKEIFLERDGEKFRLVMDYLCDGKVVLPVTVPKKSFLFELEYSDIEVVSDESIDDESTVMESGIGVFHKQK